jgi:flagellar hook-basal body complex protein FliE
VPAIDPTMLPIGPEWQIGGADAAMPALDGVTGAEGVEGAAPSGESFGSMLGKQVQNLADLQNEGAQASAALASGTAEDPASVVMSVERARLSMQLAAQLRTKGVEALNDIFHTQV